MKKILIMFGVVLILVLGFDLVITQTAKKDDPKETKDTYEELDTLVRGGEIEEALQLLEKENPKSAEWFYLKELAYVEDGSEKANEALSELYKEAADLYPEWQRMQKMAGEAALYEGNYKSAEYRLFQALRLDEEDAESWYYLGVVSYYEHRYEDMRMYFEYALERNLSETKQTEMLWYAKEVGDLE